MNFQPSELAKFAVILFVARRLDQKTDRLHTVAAGLVGNFLVPLPALLLLLLQPVVVVQVLFLLVAAGNVLVSSPSKCLQKLSLLFPCHHISRFDTCFVQKAWNRA